MKAYQGWKHPYDGTPNVMRLYGGGKPLPTYTEEKKFTEEFDWGHLGAGSLQLAYALLRDYAGSEKACLYYRAFAGEVVSHLEAGIRYDRSVPWTLTGGQIDAFLRRIEPPSALARITGPDAPP
jgi:hypothetical protein